MPKFSVFFVFILFALTIAGSAFATGDWIMEWYSLDPVRDTGAIANGIDTDWIEKIYGKSEAEISRLCCFPQPNEVGILNTGEDGSIDYNNGVYTVEAGGLDIWGTEDAFRFTYTELSGDFEIEMKVESLVQTNDWAKIGPMVRDNDATSSKYVFMLARALDGNKYFQERMSAGASATGNGGSLADASGFPIYLSITRNGDAFTGSVSTDGRVWTDVGTTTLSMSDPVLVGLAVTSHATGTLTTGVVSELLIDGDEPDFGDMTSEDIGTIAGNRQELRWSVQNLMDINDSRNLSNGIYRGQWGDMSNYVFYGMVQVDADQATDTKLHLAQDDDGKVWINGILEITSSGWTGGATTTREFDVSFDKGPNLMMVKVAEGSGGDYLNARFEDENLETTAEFSRYSVSPAGKLSVPWGKVKNLR